MARLIFQCPYTNRPIDSGIDLDPRDADGVRDYPVSVRCPHCGLVHRGVMSDGQLQCDAATPPGPGMRTFR